MKKQVTALALLCLFMVGCSPIENQARDAAAALGGIITYAQTEYLASCQANPSQAVCQAVNRGVSAQNALTTAVETYCGWSTTAPPPNPETTKCVPVKGADAALQSAIANANREVSEIRGAL